MSSCIRALVLFVAVIGIATVAFAEDEVIEKEVWIYEKDGVWKKKQR